MTRAEKIAEAQRLRDQELTLREGAERMGVALSTFKNYFYDPDLSKQKARRVRYSKPCDDCGKPTSGDGGFKNQRQRCHSCASQRQHDKRHWTRSRVIEELRAWGRELGRAPTATEALRAGARVPVVFVQRECGTWSAGLRAAGLEPKNPRKLREAGVAAEDLAARYRAGESSAELARAYGVCSGTIVYHLRLAGCKRRPPSQALHLRFAKERQAA